MAPETPIGTVSSLAGQATALSATGEVRTLAAEAEVFQDDTITTQKDSSVELLFEDGTIFSQGANSEVLLDVYVFDAAAGSGELLFNLAKGSLRAASGEIAKLNPEGFNVETPLSTVGIRGTGFFVLLTTEGQVVGVEQMDPTHVVVVETDLGQVTIAQQGQFVAVQLDGFLSDPALFTPEFLQGIQDMVPMQADPPGGEQGEGQDDAGGGQDNGQGDAGDIPQEVLDDLTGALQALQGLGSSNALQGVLGALPGDGGDGGDGGAITDTLGELADLLASLQETLQGAMGGDLPDDVLFGNAVEDILTALNLKGLLVDSNGEEYSSQLEALNYSFTATSGNDALLGTTNVDNHDGLAGNDILFGGGNTDTLNGGSGADYLYGGAGADVLIGGAGIDYLVGGSGADEFKFLQITDGGDTIRDFNASEGDSIKLDGNSYTGLGSTETPYQIDNYTGSGGSYQLACLVYDSANDILYYDSNGTMNTGGQTVIAHFEDTSTVITSVDVI